MSTTSPSTVVVVEVPDETKQPQKQQQRKAPSSQSSRRRRGGVKMQVPVHLEDFMALEDPHPYGVLPGGNQFGGGTTTRTTMIPFGLSESLWQDVLSFCDAITLGRIVQVSRYSYVSGHQPELWRDLVLRRSVPLTKNVKTQSSPSSWKDLYVSTFHDNFQKHIPMNLSGKVYSDFLYRNHLCRSFAIPSAWLEDEKLTSNTSRRVPSVDYESFRADQFFKDCERTNTPVLIRGAASTTRAYKNWNDPEYLLKTTQKTTQTTPDTQTSDTSSTTLFRATSGAAPLSADFSLPAYLNYCQSFDYWEESPLYLFDRNAFLDPQHPWSLDFFDDFYQNCPYWNVHNNNDNSSDSSSHNYGHDLLQHLGCNKKRPDHTWIILGPKRSGSVFHLDPNATHAWNVSLKGRKRWIFYPPGVAPPGVHPSEDGDEVALPLSVGEWILQYWQEHVERSSSKMTPPNERPYECTAHPGDAIFVPHGWWHMVVNLDDDYNLAMTHNYVSPSNLGNVLKFFKERKDQISGCRDRVESIKPDQLHDAFVTALEREAPQFLKEAQAQSGWTCRAFENNNNNKRMTVNKKKKKKRKLVETGDDDDQDGTAAAESSTNKNSVMAMANTSTPFSFSFL
jgi:hypothetical protein